MTRDLNIGVTFLWNWDRRFWAWFDWHGIQSGYANNGDRIFDTVYHLGPFKVKFGVKK